MNSINQSASTHWDVAIIGAGPAGAFAAMLSAQAGLRTLLIDSKAFPRDKVCGGCLNASALEILRCHGLGQLVYQAGGVPVQRLRILSSRRSLNLDLPKGVALSRKALDEQLVLAAEAAGACFLSETSALVERTPGEQFRELKLSRQVESRTVLARIVISADGLLRSSLRSFPEFASAISPQSRMGAGTTLDDSSEEYPAGQITMAVSRNGYVGLAQVEGGRLNIAAALDPLAVKASPSLWELVRTILEDAGCAIPESVRHASWQGTPMLTSHPQSVASRRIFLVGDAAGYVEPFTGEGIATALESVAAVIPLVVRGSRVWAPELVEEWTRQCQTIFRRRQWLCRSLAAVLRSPRAISVAIHAFRWFPSVPRFLINKINRRGPTTGIDTQGSL